MKTYQEILTQIYQNVKTQNSGNVADYIPELAKINPEKLQLCYKICEKGLAKWKQKSYNMITESDERFLRLKSFSSC